MPCSPPVNIILLLIIGMTIPKSHLLSQNQIVEVDKLPDFVIKAGNAKSVTIPFQIKYGYHIQADTVNDDNLIAAELTFDYLDGIDLGKLDYPEFKEFQLRGTDDKLLVFDGEFRVMVEIKVSKSVKKGSYSLPSSLYYQACDSARCLFPRRLNFQLPIVVID